MLHNYNLRSEVSSWIEHGDIASFAKGHNVRHISRHFPFLELLVSLELLGGDKDDATNQLLRTD